MRNNYFILLLFFIQFSFSQEKEREVLVGKVVSDSLEVENITVLNLSSNIGSVSDFDGKFSIKARINDTLVFQGLSFVSKKYVLTESDFLINEFKVKLEGKLNELNEVVVTPNSLTGNLAEDSKKIKVYVPNLAGIDFSKLSFPDDQYSKVANPLEKSGFSPLTGINFNKILDLFDTAEKREKRKKIRAENIANEKWLREVQSESFYDHLMKRYSHNFIVENLKIKKEDIVSFVAFADPGSHQLAEFLKSENELKFVEYLVAKSSEFNRNKLEENNTNLKYED
ncbi:MAG: hypothetical protein R2790_01260 [Flavobacterium haoranii]